MENLPDDLRIEILLRLPIKSLARLKCVSKSWLSLISDPNFLKLHFQISSRYTHRFPYLVHADQDHNHLKMRAIDVNVSFHDNSADISFDFPSEYNVILASCRGFLLLQHTKKDKLLVWNPLTSERKQIILPQTHIPFELYGFCYDESIDDYLIVLASLMGRLAFQFFSIGTNSWNKELAFNCGEPITTPYPVVVGSVVNGVIHWLVSFHQKSGLPIVNILALDIKTKKVYILVTKLDDIDLTLCYLIVFGESLALVDISDYEEIKVWVMEEHGGKSSFWTKLMSIPRSQEARYYFSPLCLTKDGQLVALHSPLALSKWSSEQGKLEDRKCNGYLKPYSWFEALPVYTETLLSLPSQS